MKEEHPYGPGAMQEVRTPAGGGVPDGAGWWDVHTHRRAADWRYAILNCPPGEILLPCASPSSSGRQPVHGLSDASGAECSWNGLSGPPLYLSAGIHPWYLTEDNFPLLWEWLLGATRDKRVVAIGEAGLDKKTNVSFDLQCVAFRRVVALADELNLPLLIHAVKTADEIIRMKKDLRPRNPWIIHGFRGRKELAQAYLRQGIYLSYGEKYQEEALRATPLDSLFIETDESETGVCELYGRAAKVLEITEEKLRERIEQNINKLFFRQ